MTLKTVKLSALRLSPLNVRKVEPKNIESLAADIEAHGVLQNLVTYNEGRNHMICAGGRRFRALKLLQKQKTIKGDYAVPVDIRSKKEAVELSLAENSQREDMHPADAVAAYGELIKSGMEVEDIAARFGVSPTYVKRVLKLAALHPKILEAFAHDEIGMGAAQAYTLADDLDRQLEVFEVAGDRANHVRSLLTEQKIDTSNRLFNFISLEEYGQAGGTITADLFAEEGAGYADNPEILFKLLEAKLEKAEQEARQDGWKEVELCDGRPDNFYMTAWMDPQGRKEPSKKQQKRLEEIFAGRKAIVEADKDADRFYNPELQQLDREEEAIERSLSFFTDEQKADGKAILFLGHDGRLELHARDLTRRSDGKAGGSKAPKRDYSAKLEASLHRIKTLAVREAVAQNPDLAFDLMLHTLLSHLVHGANSFAIPLSIKPEGRAVEVEESLLTQSDIQTVEEVSGDMFERLDCDSLEAVQKLDRKTKQSLFAALVASQIDAQGCCYGDGVAEMDELAAAAQIDMFAKWQPSIGFFEKVSKPTMLKILREQCGESAADNCSSMKKADLVPAMADRLAGTNWLPPVLVTDEAKASKEAKAVEEDV